jgi:predicted MPP superfamily phosphohydrolase
MPDLAIVHLTDLHYPASGADQADWVVSLIRALGRVAVDRTLTVAGLAVTGDLVYTPDVAGFASVAAFLDKALGALKLGPERRWLVDGNHDYRPDGHAFFGYNKYGIEAGRHLTRHDRFVNSDFFVLGIDSARYGTLARGKFTTAETQRLEGLRGDVEAGRARFRIALVHHNVLPLPRRPPDRYARRKLKEVFLGEEGFSLFRHGSALVHHLIEADFDLVLHGHEHESFAAYVSYLDSGRRSTLAVLGGVDARRGFQVVRFRPTGDVIVERVMHRSADLYAQRATLPVQHYLDWKRAVWSREARRLGRVERCGWECALDNLGDLRETMAYETIIGGEEQPIGEFTIRASVDCPLGVARIDRAVNRSTRRRAPEEDLETANQALRRASYTFRLEGELREDQPHPGFEAEIRFLNGFAMTRQETAWRGMPQHIETFAFRAILPAERAIFSLRFPDHFRPSKPELIVLKVTDQGEAEDPAETHHAARQLVYNGNTGIVFLDLQWVLPFHRYVLRWDLPRARSQTKQEIDGVRAVRQLLALPLEKSRSLDRELRTVRDSFCRAFEAAQECSLVDLALFGFDERQRRIALIAGTYPEDGPERGATLGWGEGIQGLVLRRGAVTYYSSAEPDHRYFYRPLPDCPEEAYMFCIPIPLPARAREGMTLPLERTKPRVIVTLSSRVESVMQLLRGQESFDRAATLLYADITALLEKGWPAG